MANVTRRWSGDTIQRSPSAWTATVEYDAAGYVSPDAAESAVMAYAGISSDASNPSTHPASTLMYFAGLASREEGYRRWIVTANYSTSPLGFFPNPNNPLLDPPTYQWQLGNEAVAVDQDGYGNAILNTAGVPLTGATRNFALLTWIVTRNEPTYNPAIALNYVNRCNSQAMTILGLYNVGSGQVLLRSYQPTTEQTQNSPYVRNQYVLEARPPINPNKDADGLFDSHKERMINKGRVGWYTDSNGLKQQGFFGRGVQGIGFTESSEDLLLDASGIPLKIPGAGSKWQILDWTTTPPKPVDPIACPYTLPTNVAKDTDPKTGVIFLKYLRFPPVDLGGLNL